MYFNSSSPGKGHTITDDDFKCNVMNEYCFFHLEVWLREVIISLDTVSQHGISWTNVNQNILPEVYWPLISYFHCKYKAAMRLS